MSETIQSNEFDFFGDTSEEEKEIERIFAEVKDLEEQANEQLPPPPGPESAPPPPEQRPEKAQTKGGYYVNPETGEVLDLPFALEKLGWSEMPKLSANPSMAELIEFEKKVDQVVDRVASYKDKVANYKIQLEKRIQPYEGAILFWEEFILEPAKALAEKKLRRYKKDCKSGKAGDFAEKTMHLESGDVSFRKEGGMVVEDFDAIKEHILKDVPQEQWPKYFAKPSVSVDYNKFGAALRRGEYGETLVGTSKKKERPLATMIIKSPGGSGALKEEEDS